MYLQKRNERSKTISHPCLRSQIIGFRKREEKKKKYYSCESISFKGSPAHMSTCAPSVCGMCRYHLSVQLDPPPPITQTYTNL